MRTDGHDEANSRISQFCERASKCNFTSRIVNTTEIDLKVHMLNLLRLLPERKGHNNPTVYITT